MKKLIIGIILLFLLIGCIDETTPQGLTDEQIWIENTNKEYGLIVEDNDALIELSGQFAEDEKRKDRDAMKETLALFEEKVVESKQHYAEYLEFLSTYETRLEGMSVDVDAKKEELKGYVDGWDDTVELMTFYVETPNMLVGKWEIEMSADQTLGLELFANGTATYKNEGMNSIETDCTYVTEGNEMTMTCLDLDPQIEVYDYAVGMKELILTTTYSGDIVFTRMN